MLSFVPTSRGGQPFRGVSGILNGFPAHFQKKPFLRVGDLRVIYLIDDAESFFDQPELL